MRNAAGLMTVFIIYFEADFGQGADIENLYSHLSLISEASGMQDKHLNFFVLLFFHFVSYCFLQC